MQPENEKEKTKLERLKKIFMDMYAIYDIRPEGYLLKFNSFLYDLLFALIHSYSNKIIRNNIDKSYKYLERLNEIMLFIKEHYCEKITLSDLSEQFRYNEDYLSHFFKKHTGMTINEYLYAYRITKVSQDLLNTDMSVNDIFAKHGCTNYRVSMRTFKEIYGCTPKEKRKELNGMIPK